MLEDWRLQIAHDLATDRNDWRRAVSGTFMEVTAKLKPTELSIKILQPSQTSRLEYLATKQGDRISTAGERGVSSEGFDIYRTRMQASFRGALHRLSFGTRSKVLVKEMPTKRG